MLSADFDKLLKTAIRERRLVAFILLVRNGLVACLREPLAR